MPRLWKQTIEEHRRDVREAILDTTWELVAERGLLSVTMSQIAAQTGIGRATLYKYFPDVEAILRAHHDRHVAGHLQQLTELSAAPGGAAERLEGVLLAYARICRHRGRQGTGELGALLHREEHVAWAQQQLHDLFRDLLNQAVASGDVRSDVRPDELARYCMYALSAAGRLPSDAAVRRLVEVTMTGLRARAG